MSSFNWNQIDFNLIVHPFRVWNEIIILAANNLFNFIFASRFGENSILCFFYHRDLISSLAVLYVHGFSIMSRTLQWFSSLKMCLNMSVLVLNVWGMDSSLNTLKWLIKFHTSCWKFPIQFEIQCMEFFTYLMTFGGAPNTSIYLTFILIAFRSPWIKVSYSATMSVYPGVKQGFNPSWRI